MNQCKAVQNSVFSSVPESFDVFWNSLSIDSLVNNRQTPHSNPFDSERELLARSVLQLALGIWGRCILANFTSNLNGEL